MRKPRSRQQLIRLCRPGLIAAGLLAPALTAPGAASAATNYGTTRPLAAIARSIGNVDVYWRGSNGYLDEKVESGGVWRPPVQTPIGGLLSSPTATIGSHGYDYVFWEGTDRNLWEAAAGPSGWIGPTKLGMGPLGSQPTAASIPNSSGVAEIDVFWMGDGTGANLWQADYLTSTGKWTGPTYRAMGPLGSAPTATEQQTSAGPQIQVFWKGTDNALWEGYTSGGSTWTGPKSHGMGPLGSAPSAASLSYGKEIVFWAGTTTTLWQGNWDSASWNGLDLNGPNSVGFGPMASAPTVAPQQPDGWDVFWIGTDGNLWGATSQGAAWTSDQSLGSLNIPPPPAPTPPPTTTPTTTDTTSTITPPKAAPKHVRVRTQVHWKWDGRRTRLRWIRFGRMPKHTILQANCLGAHCFPPLKAATRRQRLELITLLEHRVYHPRQRLLITLSKHGWKAERVEFWIRNGKEPHVKLLR